MNPKAHWYQAPDHWGVPAMASWQMVILRLPGFTVQRHSPLCRVGNSTDGHLHPLRNPFWWANICLVATLTPKPSPVPWSKWAHPCSLPRTARQNLECSLHTSLQCFLLRLKRTAFSNLPHKAPLIFPPPSMCAVGIRTLQVVADTEHSVPVCRSTVRPDLCQTQGNGFV